MSIDPRLTALRLASNWASKVERDEMQLSAAFDMLIERVAAIVPKISGLSDVRHAAMSKSCILRELQIRRSGSSDRSPLCPVWHWRRY